MDPQTALPDRLRAVAISGVLLAVAIALGSGVWQAPDPVPVAEHVPAWVIDPTPVRHPDLKPEYEEVRCSECHADLPAPEEPELPLGQHTEIVLKHGINTRCFNCHHRTNRDFFVDYYGREIPFDQPQLVCRKCHGPVYRDWLHGVHGRTNGFWNKAMGPQEHRMCIECHDPHTPPFPPMPPAPGPHTLRMGEQGVPHDHDVIRNPLRIYQHEGAGHWPTADEIPGEDDRESH